MSEKESGISLSNKSAMRNPFFLGLIGSIVIVVLVNAAFITIAKQTNVGLVEEGYYERGRDHERNFIKRQEAINSLQWTIGFNIPEKIYQNAVAPYRVSLVDEVGVPVKGAVIQLHAYRPSDAKADFDTTMVEIYPGTYEANIRFAMKGTWDLKVAIHHEEEIYPIDRRISVLSR